MTNEQYDPTIEVERLHREAAEKWRTQTSDPYNIANAMMVFHAEAADIWKATRESAPNLVEVGALPPDSSFEYDGRICRRGGIYCSYDNAVFGLDADTLVIPRPDIDANILRNGGIDP